MPDISAFLGLLDATFFLYKSKRDAEIGANYGGSGVVVGVTLKSRSDLFVRYGITNWHVACRDGFSTIRLNMKNGKTYIIEKDPSEWTFLPGKQDLAGISLDLPPDATPSVVLTNRFIGYSEKDEAHIGDELFMVGRFIDFDGRETNQPATRFGFVSMMNAAIRQPTNFSGPSIIVDMHSRTGFSGSPVYVYRPGNNTVLTEANFAGFTGKRIPGPPQSLRKWGIGNNVQIRLLGILWGQFPERWDIKEEDENPQATAARVTNGAYVKG